MTELDTAERLATYLKDAARQRRLMEPWVEDRRFEAVGGTVIYSVDTNVIRFYTDPFGQSPSGINRARREGYAQIFREDSKELSEALGEALAAHIFEHRSKSGLPRLVISPLEREVGSIFAAIVRAAEEEHSDAREEIQRLRQITAELEALLPDRDAVTQKITEKAPALIALFRRLNSGDAQLRRFSRLFSGDYVSSVDHVIESAIPLPADLRQVLLPISNLNDLVALLRMKSEWEDRLLQTKSSNTSMNLIENDASALARIEWMNNSIEGQGFRFVQITGDRALLRAARTYQIDDQHSFADRYLREPASFLGAVLANRADTEDSSERNDLLDMLDVFLGKITNRAGHIEQLDQIIVQDYQELANTVQPVLKMYPTIVSEFREKWDAYTRSIVARSMQYAAGNLNLNISNNIDDIIRNIDEQLEVKITQAWAACFGAVTRTGFDILAFQKSGQALRPRNPPPLYFKSFPSTFNFMKTITSRDSKEGLRSDVYNNALKALMEEDQGIGYLYYLAYAVLFAATGRWNIADILAEQALRVVDQKSLGKEIPELISGREAAYLKVVAKRHSVRHSDELEQIRQDLSKVYSCYERDKRNRPDLDAWPARFESERIALDLMHHLFSIFCNHSMAADAVSLATIQEQIIDQLRAIDETANSWVGVHVERNFLTNLFMIALIRNFYFYENTVSTAELRPFYERFQKNINLQTDHEIGSSFLVRTIFDISTWWFTSTSRQKKGLRDRILVELSDNAVKEAVVFPYDQARFRFLRLIVEGKAER